MKQIKNSSIIQEAVEEIKSLQQVEKEFSFPLDKQIESILTKTMDKIMLEYAEEYRDRVNNSFSIKTRNFLKELFSGTTLIVLIVLSLLVYCIHGINTSRHNKHIEYLTNLAAQQENFKQSGYFVLSEKITGNEESVSRIYDVKVRSFLITPIVYSSFTEYKLKIHFFLDYKTVKYYDINYTIYNEDGKLITESETLEKITNNNPSFSIGPLTSKPAYIRLNIEPITNF